MKQLLRLYNNLPAKLQSRKKEISAAELILKAIEFITLLREVLALNPEDDANNDDTDVHNDEDEGFSRNGSDIHSYPNDLHEHQSNRRSLDNSSNNDHTSPHPSFEDIKDGKHYEDHNTSMEQDVCIEINPSDILPPLDEGDSIETPDIRFEKSLDCAQVKSTISLPRNLRITPVGKLYQSKHSRAKGPDFSKHQLHNSSSQYSSSHKQLSENEANLPPPTLIRKDGSLKSPTSILGHKVIKIPPANGDKGLPTVIEFPKGSPFLTKLDTDLNKDEEDRYGDDSKNDLPNNFTGQSLLRKHLQEPAKGIQDQSERTGIRIRKDLGVSPDTNKYNILGNNSLASTPTSSSSNNTSIVSYPNESIEYDADITPKLCISSVTSLKNKENPFTDALQRNSIERRRGRPVVPKKVNSSRQSQEFDGELAIFRNFDKYDFFNYLSTSCLRITDKDAETILTYNWMHDLLFEIVFSLCSEAQFARFCLVVSQSNNDSSNHNVAFNINSYKKTCILVQNPAWLQEKIKGMLQLSGRDYCLPLLLLKLFRPNYEQVLLSKIVLYSKRQCEISNPDSNILDRASTICINPWHYERCDEEKFLSKSVGHECQVRLFADSENGTRALCFLCKSPGTIGKVSLPVVPLPLSPPTPPPPALFELTPINVTNNVIPDQESELKIYVEKPKYKIGDKEKIVTIRKKKSLPANVAVASKKLNTEETNKKQQPTVRRPQIKYDGSVCINCKTTTTTLWRRTPDAQLICNACGCYFKLHGKHRPIKYKSDAIRTRSRRRGATKKKEKLEINQSQNQPIKVESNVSESNEVSKYPIHKIAEELEQKSIQEEQQSINGLNILLESGKTRKAEKSVDEKSAEEMEQDFEGMIQDFEDEINQEGDIEKLDTTEVIKERVSKEVITRLQDVIAAKSRNSRDRVVEGREDNSSTNVSSMVPKENINVGNLNGPDTDTEPDEILLIIDESKEMDDDIIADDIEMIEQPSHTGSTIVDASYANGSIDDAEEFEALDDTISVNAVEDAISVSSGTSDNGPEDKKKRFINVIDGNTNGINIIDLKKEAMDVDDSDTGNSEKSDMVKPKKHTHVARPMIPNNIKDKAKPNKASAGHYGYQCKRCFDWFDTKLDLNHHNCTKRYLMSEDGNMSIYVCKFCGCFEHDKSAIQPHVDRCKTFGFSNLYSSEGMISQQQGSATKQNDIRVSRNGRKRPNRQTLSSKEESTCSQCNFVSFIYRLLSSKKVELNHIHLL